MLKKNDEIRLTIDAMTAEGSGIGRYDGMAVFVPNTAVGDTVLCHIIKAKKNYAVGKAFSVLAEGVAAVVQGFMSAVTWVAKLIPSYREAAKAAEEAGKAESADEEAARVFLDEPRKAEEPAAIAVNEKETVEQTEK